MYFTIKNAHMAIHKEMPSIFNKIPSKGRRIHLILIPVMHRFTAKSIDLVRFGDFCGGKSRDRK